MYEVSNSDPNSIRPREFKQLYRNIPLEMSESHMNQLHQLTAGSGAGFDLLKKNTLNQDYVGYYHKSKLSEVGDPKRARSQAGFSKRKSVNLNKQPAVQDKRDEFGKKKRQRFNEELGEDVISKKSGVSLNAYQNSSSQVRNRNHFLNEKGA